MPALGLASLVAVAAPAAALTPLDLAGTWRGEGEWAAEGEPAQRLRCQMRGTPADGGGGSAVVLVGRCATAQGGQSFAWRLAALGDGRLLATDEGPREREAPPPAPLPGRMVPDGLSFDLPGGGRFDLARAEGGLRLVLTGRDGGRTIRAAALLERAP